MQAKKKRRKWPWVVLSLVIVVAIVGGMFFTQHTPTIAADVNASTATATRGSITTTVVGTGNLQADGAEEIKMPSTLKYTEVLVESGDYVTQGQRIAIIDQAKLQSSIASLEKSISETDAKIASAMEDDESSIIRTQVEGRVKQIHVDDGDDVKKAMSDYGALIVLSIDGRMAVTFPTSADLTIADEVSVVLENGKSKEGKVKSIGGGICTVTLNDNGPKVDEAVTIEDKDGNEIGSGTLFIHQPLEIIGLEGAIKEIHVSENDKVAVDKKLITLESTFGSYEYQELLTGRSDMMKDLQKLLALSESYVLTAPFDGLIETVNIEAEDAALSADSGDGAQEQSTGDLASQIAAAGKMQRAQAVKLSAKSNEQQEEGEGQEETPEPTEKPAETEEPQDTVISKLKLDIAAPVIGEMPMTVIDGGKEFSGEIRWEPADEAFAAETGYIAFFTITPGKGFIVAEDVQIKLDGAKIREIVVAEDGLQLTFTAEFPATGKATPEPEPTPTPTQDMPDGGMPTQNPGGDYPSGMGDYDNLGNYSGLGGSMDMSGLGGGAGDATDYSALGGSSDSTTLSTLEDMIAYTIVPEEKAILPVTVDELDILSIKEGQKATVVFDAMTDQEFTGEITKIAQTANASNGVAKYDVEITLTKDASMRTGMNASATITIDSKDNILLLPIDALQERGKSTFVYTSVDEETGLPGDPVEVETGLSDGVNVEIVSGLSEEDTVYYVQLASDNTMTFNGMTFPAGGGMQMMPSGGGSGGFSRGSGQGAPSGGGPQ